VCILKSSAVMLYDFPFGNVCLEDLPSLDRCAYYQSLQPSSSSMLHIVGGKPATSISPRLALRFVCALLAACGCCWAHVGMHVLTVIRGGHDGVLLLRRVQRGGLQSPPVVQCASARKALAHDVHTRRCDTDSRIAVQSG
jgi:hypothetical protein